MGRGQEYILVSTTVEIFNNIQDIILIHAEILYHGLYLQPILTTMMMLKRCSSYQNN